MPDQTGFLFDSLGISEPVLEKILLEGDLP